MFYHLAWDGIASMYVKLHMTAFICIVIIYVLYAIGAIKVCMYGADMGPITLSKVEV